MMNKIILASIMSICSFNAMAYSYGDTYNNNNDNYNNNVNNNNNSNRNYNNNNSNANASANANGGTAVVNNNNDNGYYYPPAFSVGGSNSTTIGTVSKGASISTPFGGFGFQSSDDHAFTQAYAAYHLHDPAVHALALQVIKQELQKHVDEEKKTKKSTSSNQSTTGAFGY